MSEWGALFAAFLLGLFSSAHCIGMCGGIMGALGMAIPAEAKSRRRYLLLAYNLGRIGSYAFMGLLVGLFASALSTWSGVVWLRVLAGLLLIAMGLYLADWWRGLTYLERVGQYFWAYLQPIGRRLMPVKTLPKALMLGMLWGWLPCGLVYSALVYAMAQGQALWSAGTMLAFGLGTLPAVLAAGLAMGQFTLFLQRRFIRRAIALLIIIFGVWTLFAGGQSHHHHVHSAPHGMSNTSNPPNNLSGDPLDDLSREPSDDRDNNDHLHHH